MMPQVVTVSFPSFVSDSAVRMCLPEPFSLNSASRPAPPISRPGPWDGPPWSQTGEVPAEANASRSGPFASVAGKVIRAGRLANSDRCTDLPLVEPRQPEFAFEFDRPAVRGGHCDGPAGRELDLGGPRGDRGRMEQEAVEA